MRQADSWLRFSVLPVRMVMRWSLSLSPPRSSDSIVELILRWQKNLTESIKLSHFSGAFSCVASQYYAYCTFVTRKKTRKLKVKNEKANGNGSSRDHLWVLFSVRQFAQLILSNKFNGKNEKNIFVHARVCIPMHDIAHSIRFGIGRAQNAHTTHETIWPACVLLFRWAESCEFNFFHFFLNRQNDNLFLLRRVI